MTITLIPTLESLNSMSELAFDRATARLERLEKLGNEEAAMRLGQIDAVVDAVGTFDLDFMPGCEYTFAHTRTWCGNPVCRDS